MIMAYNSNSKIKVAFFGDDFSRKGKGTALVIQKIAEQFVNEFSDRIELVIIRKAGYCDNQISKKVRNIEIKRIPFLGTAISYLLFFIFNKEKFDIVMFNKLVYPGFWFLNSKKFVLLAHDAPISSVYKEKLMFSGRLFYWFLGMIGKYFLDAIVVDSEDAKREIVGYHRLNPEKVFVVYDAAGEEFRKFSEEEKANAKEILREKYNISPPYILDVSRLDPHKNILNVLKAYLIFRKNSDFLHKLVLVGGSHTSDYSKLVKERVLNSKFKDDILFAEYIEPEDLPALYNLADILAFPSLLEGFGLPLVEAMKCGVPVITSDISSMPEIIGDAGIKVNPLDANLIAKKMAELLGNKELMFELSNKGLERGKIFSWENTAKEMIKIYENCLRS